MATPQELKNALMLKKANPNLTTEQAVNQARVPVTSTSQINQDQLAQNQASRQAIPSTPTTLVPTPTVQPITNQSVQQGVNAVGGTAEQRRQTRTDITANQTVTPTPVTPTTPPPVQNVSDTTPVTPPVQQTATTTQPIDKNAEIKAKNEAKLAENQQKAQLAEQTRQQGITEQNTALANNESAILNTLKVGGMIPETVKTSPFYKSAQDTFNKVRAFSTYSVNNLVGAMNNGSLLPGTKVYNELLNDPAMKQKLTEAQTFVAKQPVNIETVTQNVSNNILANNPTLATALSDGVITMDEYNQATNNPEVVAKAKDVETKTNEYNKLKAEYDGIEDEVKAQFPGSPFADSIIADRQKAKYKNLVLAKGEVDSAIGTLTELKTQSSSLFDKNLELYKQRQTESQQIAKEQRDMQAKKDLVQYQADFEKQQAEEALNDPATQIKATMDEFDKMGIVAQGDLTSKIAEFKASGKTLPEYITGLRQQFMSKPEYKKIQELQAGQLSDAQKLQSSQAFDLKKMGLEQSFQIKLAQAKQTTNNKWTKLDDGMYTNEAGEIITADELKNAKLLNNSYINKPVGSEGGECGFYASRGTGMSATPGGNSKEARFNAFSETTPQVGGMAFFGGEGYDKTYGHIAIVTGVNADGTITVKDSNYRGDGKVAERTVKANTVSGYYNNTPLAKGLSGGTTTQPTSSEANSWVNAWNNGTMDIETILTKIGNTKEALPLKNEVIKAIDAQGGVAWRKENDPMVTKVDDLINKLDTASKSNYLNTIAGTVQTSLANFLTGGKSDLLADLKTVIEGGTLQSLIDAKAQGATFGALSNEELKMLQATSSAIAANAIRDPDTKEIIGFKMSESKLKSELDKMKNLLVEKKARMTGAGLKQEQPITTQTNTGTVNTGGGQTYQGYTIKGL